MRTITNPTTSSALSSSVMRTELQTLETEIASITVGHNHDGADSYLIDKASLGLGNVDNTSDTNKPISSATQSALDALDALLDDKLDKNAPITGATKTKITYDSNGLITSGTNATTADISEATDKRYVTDAQLVVISNTSNTNTGDQDLSGYVPTFRTVNGKALTSNITLTTADIADSSNKRYVTDAQLVILGNTSNTNSGDETQATIKTKLGVASSGVDGYISGTDWNTFNGKQASLGFTPEQQLTFTSPLLRSTNTISLKGLTGFGTAGQVIKTNATADGLEWGSGATGGGHTIQDEGTPLTQRDNLNFAGTGVTATDDAGNNATLITIPSYSLPTATASVLGGIKVGTRLSIDGNGVLSADVQAGGGDVVGPATNTDGYIPQWDGADSKTLKDGLAVPAGGLAGLTALGTKQAQLNGTGFVKATGTTISYDNSTYLTSLNGALLLDQTTPQTIINGRVIMGQGLQLGTSPTVGSYSQGKLYWDDTNKSGAIELDTNVTLQLGLEELVYAYNATGSQINNGQAVIVSSAYLGVPTIELAKADSAATYFVFGLATENIAASGYGYVTLRGIVNGVDTSSFNVGDELFLSATVSGGLQNTAPSSPNYKVRIGRVLVSNATTGSIGVRQRIATRMGDLADADIPTPVVGDMLQYNGTTWVNIPQGQVSAGGGVEVFLDDTITIDNYGGLLRQPDTITAEQVDTATFTGTAGTRFIEGYLYNQSENRTKWDSGTWQFNLWAYTNNADKESELITGVYRVQYPGGTVAITGSGTSRTADITGATPFVAGDANADVILTSYLQTAGGTFEITGYTDNNTVTIATPSGYSNETGVAYSIHRYKFQVTTGDINNTVNALYSLTTIQPEYAVDTTDTIAVRMYGKTTSTKNPVTINYTHNGSTHYSYIKTPFMQRHNELAQVQGIVGAEAYHLSLAQHTIAVNAATSGNAGYLTASDWSLFNGKVDKSLYDANTILYATTDNTPTALTVGASTIMGRKATGDISAMSATETRTILNVADGATANTKATGAEIDTGTDDTKFATAKAIADSKIIKNPMTTACDIIVGGTSGAPARLAKGTALQVPRMNADASAIEWAAPSGGGVWSKLYDSTLGSDAASIDSGTITGCDLLQIYIVVNFASNGSAGLQFNEDTGSNYGYLVDVSGSGGSATTGATGIKLYGVAGTTENFITLNVTNLSAKRKFLSGKSIGSSSGSSLYPMNDIWGIWNNNSSRITRINLHDVQNGNNLLAGSRMIIMGANIA
jgi:hypothetical protein